MLDMATLQNLTEADCIKIQHELAARLRQENMIALSAIQTVAGVDLAYWEDNGEQAVCCISVIDLHTKRVLADVSCSGPVVFPYIPGCLAFRELPLILKTAAQLPFFPDVYMFDGNGILHPRRMGIATHASFILTARRLA